MPVADLGEVCDEALRSILDQTFTDLEVILSLSGESRDAEQTLRKRHSDPRVRIVVCGLRQVAHALNRALEVSVGEYIARMDADDVSEPDRIAAQVALLDARRDIDVVGTQIGLIDEQGRPLPERREMPTDSEAIRRVQWREGGISHPTVMMHRSVLVAAGGYSGGVEDLELWLRLRRQGVRFANLGHALLRYRLHSMQAAGWQGMRRVASETFGRFMRELVFAPDPRFLAGAARACAARFLGPRSRS